MKTPRCYYHGYSESYSVGECSSESTGKSTSTSTSTSTSHTVATCDPWRHTRMHLEWNLEDLGSCLEHCDDLIEDDFEWYADRARRIFQNALRKKQGGLDGENS